MSTPAKSVSFKLLSRNTIPSGVILNYEYNAQLLGVRLLIHAPWRVDDLETWLSEIEKATTISGIANNPLDSSYPDFIERITQSYRNVWQCEAIPKEGYEYIMYKSVGESAQALKVLRAVIYVDHERFRQHIHKVVTGEDGRETKEDMAVYEADPDEELGKTLGRYYDSNADVS